MIRELSHGAIAIALASCTTIQPVRPVRYVDAHSHIATGVTPEEEVAALRASGLARVVIMHPDPVALDRIAKANPEFVIPFASIARLPEMEGVRLDTTSAEKIAALLARHEACGIGEIPTRIVPQTEDSDADALLNPDRLRIYALADTRSLALNMHTDVSDDRVAAAIAKIASSYPRAKIILAHSGWSASADRIRALMNAHPNIYADLSVRLDPYGGLPSDPLPDGSRPPGAGSVISILRADGSLLPEWRALVRRHPDRFMFAMDITQGQRPHHIAELVATAHKALSPLGTPIETAVASGNIERLVGECP